MIYGSVSDLEEFTIPTNIPIAMGRANTVLKPQTGLAALVFMLLTSQVLARENQELKIAKTLWCPYICSSGEQGSPGYITETIQYILTQKNYRIKYFELNFARSIQLVEQGKLDLVLSIFKAESDHLIYNKVPVAFSHNYFFTLTDSRWYYNTIASLRQMRLGAIQGYDYLDDALNHHIHTRQVDSVTMVSGARPQQRLLQLLKKGRIDTFLDDLAVVRHELTKLSPDLQVKIAGQTQGAEPIFIAVSPHLNDAELLLSAIDNGLRLRNTRSVQSDIQNRYQIYTHRNQLNSNTSLVYPESLALPVKLPLNPSAISVKE